MGCARLILEQSPTTPSRSVIKSIFISMVPFYTAISVGIHKKQFSLANEYYYKSKRIGALDKDLPNTCSAIILIMRSVVSASSKA
jgi:hypothetical protein